MAWDTEATRRRLLEAGARQFAAHGFAGARVDAVARDAGVNKERVYRYFGDKQQFFAAVLSRELEGLLDGIVFDGSGADAVGTSAGRLFDRFVAHPELPRLLAWESLELPESVGLATRRTTCAANASSLRDALPGLGADDAEHLLLSIVSLVAGWWLLDGVRDAAITADRSTAVRRRALVAQVTALASAIAEH